MAALILSLNLWAPSAFAADEPLFDLEGPKARVTVWDDVVFTLHTSGASSSNCFTDTTVVAVVKGPGGLTERLDGYCDADDGSVFRVRHMPRLPGTYVVNVSLRDARGSGSARATYIAAAGGRKGPLRVDPKHPFHFIWEGTGEHMFWNGTTAYFLAAWEDESVVRAILDRYAKFKVNRVRIGLHYRAGKNTQADPMAVDEPAGFRTLVAPWPARNPLDLEHPNYDVQRFDLAMWRRVERILSLARERDIVVTVIFGVDAYEPGGDAFGRQNAGGADEQRYYRYAAARLSGFSNLTWDLMNEYRHSRTNEWAEKMGKLIKSADPWRHLVSIHGHSEFWFRKSKWADMALYQLWDDCGDNVFMLRNRVFQASTGRIIPQVNDEYGYEDGYPPFGCGENGAKVAPAHDAETRRRLAWRMAMVGTYQTTGEANGVVGDTSGKRRAFGWQSGLGRNDKLFTLHRHMVNFFTSFPWWELEPHIEISSHWSLALAAPGRRYVIWTSKRPRWEGRIDVHLEPGRYHGYWYNPRTGEKIDGLKAEGGAWRSPVVPDDGDWAIYLERDGLVSKGP